MRLRAIPGSIDITAGTKLILRDLEERTSHPITVLSVSGNRAKFEWDGKVRSFNEKGLVHGSGDELSVWPNDETREKAVSLRRTMRTFSVTTDRFIKTLTGPESHLTADKAEETIAHLTTLLEEAMNEAKKG